MNVVAATEPLLERKEELARIESALADARTGRGRFVVVEGPAGIGKTAVLAAARTAAAEAGMRVLRSRATEMETNFGFGVVRQLFERPLAEASELERADLLQGAAGVAAGLLGLPGAPTADAPPSSGVDPSFAILHGLYWLCANLAAVGPHRFLECCGRVGESLGLEVGQPQVEVESRQMRIQVQCRFVMLDGKFVLALAG